MNVPSMTSRKRAVPVATGPKSRLQSARIVGRTVPDASGQPKAQSYEQFLDYDTHVRIGEELEARGALPATFMSLAPGSHHPDVWHDVNRMRTLNSEQSARGLEKHVCPLQFDIVDRLITRYSNEGELVLDPFGGLMTVPYRALGLKRRGIGIELNPVSWLDGVRHCERKVRELGSPSLFDLMVGPETIVEAAE